MTPVTVKELSELLNKLVKQGYGNYAVQVSDDDECNGFHCIWNKNSAMIGENVTYLDEKDNVKKEKETICIY
jgi:hypothetical protein